MRIRAIAAFALLVLMSPAWSMLPPPPVSVRHDALDLSGQSRPTDFVMYAGAKIDERASCVVGSDRTTDDGVRRAAVYRLDTVGGTVIWNRSLQVPGDRDGSRATHCLVAKGSLYVIIQRDVISPFEPVQTMVSAARLDAQTGELLAAGHVNPPLIEDLVTADACLSTWVKPGPGQVRLQDQVVSIWADIAVLPPPSAPQPSPPARLVEIRLDAAHLMPVE